MRSIRDILGNTQRRSFRPIGSESRLVSTTGMNIRQSIAARHTPQSQLHTQFTSPGYGFSIKDVLATSPQERRQFAVKMVEYNRELQKQKELAKAITNLDQSYKSLQQIERKKVKSIEELNRTIEETKKANQKLEEQYKAVEAAVKREKELQDQSMSVSSGSSGSGRSYAPNTYDTSTGIYTDSRGQSYSTAFPPSTAKTFSSGSGRSYAPNTYDISTGIYTDSRGQSYSTAFPPSTAKTTSFFLLDKLPTSISTKLKSQQNIVNKYFKNI
ncbi:MAG: hypothetical protein PHD34_03195 [Methanothrix soehngenii]|nr:hypothetical protein [Methanothrix soehngenii]